MVTEFISLGLIIIPFFMWLGFDTRQPQLFLALVFSLILGLYSFYKGSFKPYKNKWFLLFIAYIPINFLLTPKVGVKIYDVLCPSWVLETFLFVLIFLIAHIAISSFEFTEENKNNLLKVMVWVGIIMSLYGIVQWLGFDQFFNVVRVEDGIYGVNGGSQATGGTLGTPSLLAPFLVMIIPIALYLKKYTPAVLMTIVVFLCNSQVAIGALIIGVLFLLGTKSRKFAVITVSLFIFLSLIFSIGYFRSERIKLLVDDNGRFEIWTQIIQDIKNPIMSEGKPRQFSLTGFGLGSFKYLYHTKYPTGDLEEVFQAHNDYLELFYNTGLIGISLFLLGIFFLIRQYFPLDRLNVYLLTSFICIAVCAGGIFVFQQGAHIFYILVLTGLIKKEAA